MRITKKIKLIKQNLTKLFFFKIRRLHNEVFLDDYAAIFSILLNVEFILTIFWQLKQGKIVNECDHGETKAKQIYGLDLHIT